MHSRSRRAAEPTPTGPAVLWKYTDDEGNSFYLESKKLRIRSPFSGKSFTVRPERFTPAQVGQELKEERKQASLDLESYVDRLAAEADDDDDEDFADEE